MDSILVPSSGATRVLDKGFVRLVDSMPAYSGPLPIDGTLGLGDRRIVQAARVSYGHGTKSVREDTGLIRYLISNRHTTPLEKVRFEFHVKLPISCARQWIRHRTGSFNEVSTRYSEVKEDEVYIPTWDRMRAQDKKNRQGSGEQLDLDTASECEHLIRNHARETHRVYTHLLEYGLAREVARGVLPLDTYTEWYWTVDLHNLMNFLRLRLEKHAQWEMQQYAKAVLELARPVAPVTFETWELKEGLKHEEEDE